MLVASVVLLAQLSTLLPIPFQSAASQSQLLNVSATSEPSASAESRAPGTEGEVSLAAASTSVPLAADSAAVAAAPPSALAAAPIIAVNPKSPPQTMATAPRFTRTWLALTIANHSAATFDAWSTRRVMNQGGHELNPLLRPAAGSGALYPYIQIAPALLDYAGLRLQRSSSPRLHRMWWVPQVASTAAHFFSATHNLGVYRRGIQAR